MLQTSCQARRTISHHAGFHRRFIHNAQNPYEIGSFLHVRRAREPIVTILSATRANAVDDVRVALDSTRFDAKKFFWITSLNRVSATGSRSESSESAAQPDSHARRLTRPSRHSKHIKPRAGGRASRRYGRTNVP